MEAVQVTVAAGLVALSAVGLAMHVVAGAALLRTLRAAGAALGHALSDTSYHRPGITGGRAVRPG